MPLKCRTRPRLRSWLVASGLVLGLASCSEGLRRFDPSELDADAFEPEAQGLVIGVFPLKKDAIVDGDTVKVGGLDASLRLLAIDTEETFKSEKDRRGYEYGWDYYLAWKAAKTNRPIKVATPLGMDAKHWAQDFFAGVGEVRLERDHPKELRGRFDRFLCYVMVEKDGQWVNYNVESVRAGMSPYFTKYSYSRRFHDEFVAAQQEARAAERGIWAPGTEHYPDYDNRLQWWNARADFIAAFESKAQGRDDHVVLSNWDAMYRLDTMVGKEVSILGAVGDIKRGDGRAPTRVRLSRKQFSDFPLIFWDDHVFEKSNLESARGEFVVVRGIVSRYENRKSGRETLQIEITHPRQVLALPNYVAPGPTPNPEGGPPRDFVEPPDEPPDDLVLPGDAEEPPPPPPPESSSVPPPPAASQDNEPDPLETEHGPDEPEQLADPREDPTSTGGPPEPHGTGSPGRGLP